MIIEHDVTIRHEQYNVNEIEVLFKGEYVKFVRERTGKMNRDEYGYWVCSNVENTYLHGLISTQLTIALIVG